MKKIFFFLLISLCICSLFQGCGDDNPASPHNVTNFVTGYNQNEASVCMTLASLAYANENNIAYIRDSLAIQLANTNYTTNEKWVLDWGPALSPNLGNMMYIVKNTSTTPTMYAIAIRGTDWCFPTNWKQDILVWNFERYPYGSSLDSVAEGTLDGLNTLLGLRDSSTGKTLVSYLNTIQGNNDMYITGHSLGGALATIMISWFLDNGYGSRFKLKSYTFAAPSIGNPGYVAHFNQIINATGSESYRVINPLDLVPRFWNELDSVLIQQIPTLVPISITGVIGSIEEYLSYYNIVYQNAGIRQTLGTIFPFCTSSGFEKYKCWVAFEHDHNTYLTLLKAPNVSFYFAPCDWSEPPGK